MLWLMAPVLPKVYLVSLKLTREVELPILCLQGDFASVLVIVSKPTSRDRWSPWRMYPTSPRLAYAALLVPGGGSDGQEITSDSKSVGVRISFLVLCFDRPVNVSQLSKQVVLHTTASVPWSVQCSVLVGFSWNRLHIVHVADNHRDFENLPATS